MKKNSSSRFFISFLGATAFFFSFALAAHAAPLNFTTAESVTLSSPTTTLTIATGSVADALTTNATSVVVTMSQTTGGTFTIISPSYDLSVATSSAGGTAAISCSNGVQSAVISQTTGSTVYTITPTTTTCANASAPVISGVAATAITPNGAMIGWSTNIAADSTVFYGTTTAYGATSTAATLVTSHSIAITGLSTSTLYHYKVASAENGTSTASGDYFFTTTASVTSTSTPSSTQSGPVVNVAAGYNIVPVATVANTTSTGTAPAASSSSVTGGSGTSTIASLQAELAFLEAELQSLIAQANGGGSGGTGTVSTVTTGGASGSSFRFARNLGPGSKGADVSALQRFLVKDGDYPEAIISGYYGALTTRAVEKFQKKYNIVFSGSPKTTGYGAVGPKTRAKLNAIEASILKK